MSTTIRHAGTAVAQLAADVRPSLLQSLPALDVATARPVVDQIRALDSYLLGAGARLDRLAARQAVGGVEDLLRASDVNDAREVLEASATFASGLAARPDMVHTIAPELARTVRQASVRMSLLAAAGAQSGSSSVRALVDESLRLSSTLQATRVWSDDVHDTLLRTSHALSRGGSVPAESATSSTVERMLHDLLVDSVSAITTSTRGDDALAAAALRLRARTNLHHAVELIETHRERLPRAMRDATERYTHTAAMVGDTTTSQPTSLMARFAAALAADAANLVAHHAT